MILRLKGWGNWLSPCCTHCLGMGRKYGEACKPNTGTLSPHWSSRENPPPPPPYRERSRSTWLRYITDDRPPLTLGCWSREIREEAHNNRSVQEAAGFVWRYALVCVLILDWIRSIPPPLQSMASILSHFLVTRRLF